MKKFNTQKGKFEIYFFQTKKSEKEHFIMKNY